MTTGDPLTPTIIKTIVQRGRAHTSSYKKEVEATTMTVQWIRDDYSAEDSVLICTDSQSLCSALHHVSVDPRPRRHPWKRPSRCSCQSLHQPRRTSSPRIVRKCIHAHQILIERCRMSAPTDQSDLHHYHQEMKFHHKVSQGPNPPGTTTIWSPQTLAVVPELDHARGVRRHLSSMRCPIPNSSALAHEAARMRHFAYLTWGCTALSLAPRNRSRW